MSTEENGPARKKRKQPALHGNVHVHPATKDVVAKTRAGNTVDNEKALMGRPTYPGSKNYSRMTVVNFGDFSSVMQDETLLVPLQNLVLPVLCGRHAPLGMAKGLGMVLVQ
jgi:hypothetical protein